MMRIQYLDRIYSKIKNSLYVSSDLNGQPEALYSIELLPSGGIQRATLKKSSGVPIFDAAVEQAINAAQPLPVPSDPEVFQKYFREIDVHFGLQDAHAVANPNILPTAPPHIRVYVLLLRKEIGRFARYPIEATRLKVTGTVELFIRFSAIGDITEVGVRKSSGSAELDNEAIIAAWAAVPLPPAPPEFRNPKKSLVVPVAFMRP
jgi:TonB family protein